MSRYGWSSGREQTSPYTSMSGGAPAITDDDFSYITSEDLEDSSLALPDNRYHSRSHSANAAPEDDVLLIKNKGVTYPAHFPAYAIGDGKLCVVDVKERVGVMMDLSERGTRRIKLLYKGKQLKDSAAPIRDYGVKNNSELMAVLPELDDGSSPSEEEMVVVGDTTNDSKSRRGKKKRSKKKTNKGDGSSVAASSPRGSTSTFETPKSPEPAISGPMKKLDEIATDFLTKWVPLCEEYIAAPPSDPKKREDEHRKLSETIMQHTLLKLDGVDSEGIPEVRGRRKELIQHVQSLMKKLDVAKES